MKNNVFDYQEKISMLSVTKQFLSLGILLVIATFILGCSEFSSTVTGKVYYDGELLEIGENQRGMVVFRPVQGGATSIGVINSTGEYNLSTGTTKAIVPGDYLVSVSVVEIIPDENENYAPSGKQLTPAIYSDPLTSGITFMAKKGINSFDIKLKAVKAPVVEEASEDLEEVESSDAVENEEDLTSDKTEDLEEPEALEKTESPSQDESAEDTVDQEVDSAEPKDQIKTEVGAEQ